MLASQPAQPGGAQGVWSRLAGVGRTRRRRRRRRLCVRLSAPRLTLCVCGERDLFPTAGHPDSIVGTQEKIRQL